MTQLASFILWRLYNSIGESVVSGCWHKSYLKKKNFLQEVSGKNAGTRKYSSPVNRGHGDLGRKEVRTWQDLGWQDLGPQLQVWI